MPKFSSRTIAIMRQQVNEMLTDTCSIVSISSSSVDSAGHWTNSTSTTADVPCRLLPVDRQTLDTLVAESEKSRTYYRLILKHDQALANGDQVIVGGVTYEVTQLMMLDHTDQADKQALIVKTG